MKIKGHTFRHARAAMGAVLLSSTAAAGFAQQITGALGSLYRQ